MLIEFGCKDTAFFAKNRLFFKVFAFNMHI